MPVNTNMSDSDCESDGERVPFTNPLHSSNPDGSSVDMVPETQVGDDTVHYVADSQPPSPAAAQPAKRARLHWTSQMDIALIRQLRKWKPFDHKPKSKPKSMQFELLTATLQGEYSLMHFTSASVKARVATLFNKFTPLAPTETGKFTTSPITLILYRPHVSMPHSKTVLVCGVHI